MILDNEHKEKKKVHEWITEYTDNGKLDVVTGYFTIGALAYIQDTINNHVNKYRLILGDIANETPEKHHPLDLLNENITIEAALQLNQLSQKAVEFLRQKKVEIKTLEPNFCHAKTYIYTNNTGDDRLNYFITGSSNLTEAGLGLRTAHNVELNIAETGCNNQYKELKEWFEQLWEKPQAHKEKTITMPNGTTTKKDFKEYLIEEIQKVFKEYTPREIYYKILFELFNRQLNEDGEDPEFNKQIGRLQNTVIYNALYEFQKKAVLSLIRMLNNYNGAVLADAVGLGKTWTALAVIKFYQLQGRETLLLCPKKLHETWNRFKRHQDSMFEKDQFDYFLRYHTDLIDERLEKYPDRADSYFQNDKPKLIVIDESHNFRNDKSSKYKFLIEKILKQNEDVKVLLLTATPINNSLLDVRNQFKLLVKGRDDGFRNTLEIPNITYIFRKAQEIFNTWREDESKTINDFVKSLPEGFFTITDNLLVARSRKLVQKDEPSLTFPVKNSPPENYFITPDKIGNYESFTEMVDHFPEKLSGYQPSAYVKLDTKQKNDVLHDERMRDFFLARMMYILLVKRLESSWHSFYETVQRVRDYHQSVLNTLLKFNENYSDPEDYKVFQKSLFTTETEELDEQSDIDEYTLGKKRKIHIAEIAQNNTLDIYKHDLKNDIEALDNLCNNIKRFADTIEKETELPCNRESADKKLQKLMQIIDKKQHDGENNHNRKVVIFTTYRDTADYLYSGCSIF